MRRWLQSSRRSGQVPDSTLARGNPLLYATQYGLKLWLRADMGIQYGATMRASGTSPPAWTLSGTATRPVNIHMEIDNVGAGTALGQATYKWRENENAAYTSGVATAAGPTALGTTGLSVAMAAGPYNIDNKWDITVAQWNDQSGLGNHAVQATAGNQPLITLTGWGGYPSLTWEGDRRLVTPAIQNTTVLTALTATVGARRIWNRSGVDVGSADAAAEASSRVVGPESSRALVTPIIGAGRLTFGRSYGGTNATHFVYVNGVVAAVTNPAAGDAVTPVAAALAIGSGAAGGTPHVGTIREFIAFSQPVPADVFLALHLGIAARSPGAI